VVLAAYEISVALRIDVGVLCVVAPNSSTLNPSRRARSWRTHIQRFDFRQFVELALDRAAHAVWKFLPFIWIPVTPRIFERASGDAYR